MDDFLANNSGALLIIALSAMVLGTLLILVPQLLRAHQRNLEWLHEEHTQALERGQPLPPPDVLATAAGRTASLVPIRLHSAMNSARAGLPAATSWASG